METEKICPKCESKIGKGIQHSCSSRTARLDVLKRKNMEQGIQSLPNNQKQRVASSILKDDFDAAASTLSKSFEVCTAGRKKKLFVENNEKNIFLMHSV